MAEGVYLRGVLNNKKDCTAGCFNWVMSNGNASNNEDKDWRYKWNTYSGPFMMP